MTGSFLSMIFFADLTVLTMPRSMSFADDERLVEFCRHILRNTHLVHLELRAHDDDRTGRVVYALTEEVLAETSLFPLETVAERFQRSVALRFYRVVLTRVIEQAVHRLLKHALLVAEDDFRCLDFDEPLEAVVADDNAAVEVVQVGGGETSAVQRDEGPQFRRNDRNDLQHHPFGFVDFARLAERLDDVEPLEGLRPCAAARSPCWPCGGANRRAYRGRVCGASGRWLPHP